MELISNEEITFYQLKWDTDFFGISSAKVILHQPLTQHRWDELKNNFHDFKFISLENKNSEPLNAQLIGKETTAFLADVNIQFEKKLNQREDVPSCIQIHSEYSENEGILKIADFKFSKFTEDRELAKRSGSKVYHHWLRNSFDDKNKHFAISTDENNNINGFLLHSYTQEACIVELIAVSQNFTKAGIGSKLFRAVEFEAFNRGFRIIKVGTQLRNMGAINFYQKMGCKQIGCHQIYHLWNL